jgi:HrpA-like RNA helicase
VIDDDAVSVKVVLQLKMLGVKNVSSFPFLSPPSPVALRRGLELLLLLGALNKVLPSLSLCASLTGADGRSKG